MESGEWTEKKRPATAVAGVGRTVDAMNRNINMQLSIVNSQSSICNLQFAIINLHFAICILHFAFFPPATSAASTEVVPIDGRPFTAKLIAAGADWRLTFRADDKEREMPAADLVRWGRCPEQGRTGGLLAPDGGWIPARVVSADSERIAAESDLLGRFLLPLDRIAAIYFSPLSFHHQAEPSARANTYYRLDDVNNSRRLTASGELPAMLPTSRRQFVSGYYPINHPAIDKQTPVDAPGAKTVLKNGDMLTGLLLGIADNSVRLETDLGEIEITTDRIAAIVFPAKPRPPAAPGPRPLQAWLGLSDGTRLPADRLTIGGGTATFSALGREWKTRAENLVFLQPLGGRAIYLSDLTPVEYQQTPFVPQPPSAASEKSNLAWPWRADRNVTGGPLRSGGKLFMKGIGVHGAARLVYEISPRTPSGAGPGARAKRFQALAGIDDSTDGRGSVRFRVLVDGIEKYAGPIIRGGEPPRTIEVDLTDAKRLELVVDYADRADLLDRADWIEARIVE